ncbi:hypothetical protein Vi05172_g5619 [Venturia inaequalis]|nr:hypothetical protein Vi05172_g5619 [Venturia inaequalis]
MQIVASSSPVGQLSLHPGPTNRTSYLRLPTGQAQCRAFMIGLATNATELAILQMPSWDIDILVPANITQEEARFMLANHVRRDGYFKVRASGFLYSNFPN